MTPATARRVTLGLSGGTWLGYYALPEAERPWAYYATTGALVAWLAALPAEHHADPAVQLARAWAVIEGALQALCGFAAWALRLGVTSCDICIAVGGGDVLTAGAALVTAAIWTWRARLWPPK